MGTLDNKICFVFSIVLLLSHITTQNEIDSENFILKGESGPLNQGEPRFGKRFLNLFEKYYNSSALFDADTNKVVTYGQLKEASVRLALWLRNQGIGKGDVVSVSMDFRLDAPLFFLSSVYEGCTFIPWTASFTIENARNILKLTQPKVIFSISANLKIIKEACKFEKQNPILVTLDNDPGMVSLKEILNSMPQNDVATYEPVIIDNLEKNASIVFFTSGSTGAPKGVAHSYLSLINNVMSKFPITYPNQKSRPTLLSYFSPLSKTWYLCFITAIHEGGVYIFHHKFDPVETARVVKKFHVNFLYVTPHQMAQFVQSGVLDRPDIDLSGVEEYFTGTAIINPTIFDTFKHKVEGHSIVTDTYGLTEAAGLTYMTGYKTRPNTTADPIGFVRPNVQIKIVDLETGKAIGPYKHGEIYVKLPYLFLGYYNNPEETKKALDKEGWFHTGDLGYYDDKGELFFIERLKDMIKINDFIYVTGSIIEQELMKHLDVLEVTVVSSPHIYDGERPMAFAVKRKGSKVTEQELIKMSSTLGEYYTLVNGVVFLDFLPRLPNGKVAKVELKQMAKNYVQFHIIDQGI